MIFTKRMIPEFILSISLMFMVSCSDSPPNSTQQDTTPQLPPAKSMAMDLSIFSSDQPDSTKGGKHENYEEAATTISNVQSMMERNINLSLDLFEQADTAEAEELGNDKWQWKFTNDEQEGRLIYEVRLVAEQQSDNQFQWDVFLSSPVLQNDERHYISGTSNSTVTEGVWTYRSASRSGQPSQELAELDWQRVGDEDIRIGLTILAENGFSGSRLNYHTEGAIRMIELDSSENNGVITIAFNKDTNAGYIESSDYNNGERACWDANFENISCSEISF